MSRFVFLLPFATVTIALLSVFASWLPVTRNALPAGCQETLARFSDPIPSIFSLFMPEVFRFVAFLVLTALVVRRLYLFARNRSLEMPKEYRKVPYALLWVATISIVVGVPALIATGLLAPGERIVGIRILNPAMLLAPLALTWGEIKSVASARHVA